MADRVLCPPTFATFRYAALIEFFKLGGSNFKKSPKINFDRFSFNMPTDGRWANHLFINKPGGFGAGRFCYVMPTGELKKEAAPDWVITELEQFAANPAAYATAYGKETGKCCFCSIELTDERSVSVGYGPVCAEKWFLPWGVPKPKEEKPLKRKVGRGRIPPSTFPRQEKEKNAQIWKDLRENYGEIIDVIEDEEYFRHRIGGASFFVYGESIRDMCEDLGAYWLLDAIASYQFKARSHPQMRDFQIWELKVDLEKKEAILTGSWDGGQPLYRQRLSTSFPKSYVKFYLDNDLLYFAE